MTNKVKNQWNYKYLRASRRYVTYVITYIIVEDQSKLILSLVWKATHVGGYRGYWGGG